ncbi:MAG TPA: carboxypeptidase-like regulatory domain-containing protein [Candidatus Moranbacteria bacterium]|nr:carboxypeptidase-like regulatory domain-containing protein [Candidatus Moranbacteria bacterium]
MEKIKNKRKYLGTTFIEALTVLFIFSLITLTFYSTFSAGTRYIIEVKSRLGGLALANEKMEIVRNLKYDDIGTTTGGVSGNIPQEEDVLENGKNFHVTTLVEYVEDPYDGVYPADTAFEDYKKVTITVSWGNGGSESSQVKLFSRFVPPGLEVANPGDGILFVNVFSDQPGWSGIANSTVRVVNSDTGLDETKSTDSDGNAVFMGDRVTDSINKYEITVSQSDYETVVTMPPYPGSTYKPKFVHASVITGSVNTSAIIQNKLSDLTINTVDYLDNSVGDIAFRIEGGKILGNDATNDSLIYNKEEDSSTNSSGVKEFSDISPGSYAFTLSPLVTDYELISVDPVSPFTLFSDPSLSVKVKLASKTLASYLVKIIRSDDSTPLSGAEVKLTNALGYDTTVTSSEDGAAFFPVNSDPFLPGTYDVKITADGFQEYTSQVTIEADTLKSESVTLTLQ